MRRRFSRNVRRLSLPFRFCLLFFGIAALAACDRKVTSASSDPGQYRLANQFIVAQAAYADGMAAEMVKFAEIDIALAVLAYPPEKGGTNEAPGFLSRVQPAVDEVCRDGYWLDLRSPQVELVANSGAFKDRVYQIQEIGGRFDATAANTSSLMSASFKNGARSFGEKTPAPVKPVLGDAKALRLLARRPNDAELLKAKIKDHCQRLADVMMASVKDTAEQVTAASTKLDAAAIEDLNAWRSLAINANGEVLTIQRLSLKRVDELPNESQVRLLNQKRDELSPEEADRLLLRALLFVRAQSDIAKP